MAVLGAGHGGLAVAGVLGRQGFTVHLWDRSPERLRAVAARGGVSLDGEIVGYGPVARASDDIEAVLAGTRVVLVVIRATAHRQVAELCAPYLRDGQVVLLLPGGCGGALEFRHGIRQMGNRAEVAVGETQVFTYLSRVAGPAQVKLLQVKNAVPFAVLPGGAGGEAARLLTAVLPQLVPVTTVLETSFSNTGSFFHPVITVLNAGRIESTHGDFDYYHEGISPAVARVLEAVDAERLAVARELGVEIPSAREWLAAAYSAQGDGLYEAVMNNPGYAGVKAPSNLHHRFLLEDVPATLVPAALLATALGCPAPTMEHIIHLASLMKDMDFWQEGRRLEHMGLDGKKPEEIRAAFTQ